MKNQNGIGWEGALFSIAALLLAPAFLDAQAQAKKPAAKPQVVDMGTYKVSPPPGDRWKIGIGKEKAFVSFSRFKGGGLLSAALLPAAPQQRETDVIVVALQLPPAEWRMTEDEAKGVIINRYIALVGSETLTEKGETELKDKKLGFAKFLDIPSHVATKEGVLLEVREDRIAYFYIPPDFKKTHRYFQFESIFTRAPSGMKLYQNPGAEPVLAVVDSLEIVDPLQAIPGPDGELIRAAAAGDMEAVRQAIGRGAKPDASIGHFTPLSIAAFHGRREIIDLLLELGAGIDKREEETGGTPLLWAVQGMEPVVAEYLLERGADVNKRSKDGFSALMIAARTAQADLVSLLIERGADIHAKDEAGETALSAAAENGSLESVKFLLDRGADINAQSDAGTTALMNAIAGENAEVPKLLLDRGADVNLKTDEGWTALCSAANSGRTGIVRALIEKGANVNVSLESRDRDIGTTPLHLALGRGAFDIARMLIEAGADVNAKTKRGYTPLMQAVAAGEAGIVKLLVEKGADVNARAEKNTTALKIAKKANNKEIAKLLQAAGAK